MREAGNLLFYAMIFFDFKFYLKLNVINMVWPIQILRKSFSNTLKFDVQFKGAKTLRSTLNGDIYFIL